MEVPIEFLKIEYNAIRDEILGIKERIVKIMTLGLTGLPLLFAFSWKLDLEWLSMAIPVLTVVFVLMLLSEQNALMRAGYYIRNYIEPNAYGNLSDAKIKGWERFLQTSIILRRPDRYAAAGVYISFAVYYIGGSISTLLTLHSIAKELEIYLLIIISATLILGLVFGVIAWLVLTTFPTNTDYQEVIKKDSLNDLS